jgi:hypothetical protein
MSTGACAASEAETSYGELWLSGYVNPVIAASEPQSPNCSKKKQVYLKDLFHISQILPTGN